MHVLISYTLISSCFCLPAYAAKHEIHLDGVDNLSLAIELDVNGHEGQWLPALMAKRIQADIEAYRKQNEHILLLEDQLAVREERLSLLRDSLNLQKEATQAYKDVIEEAVRGRREAEESRDSFFAGQPGVWALVGAIATSIIIVLARN